MSISAASVRSGAASSPSPRSGPKAARAEKLCHDGGHFAPRVKLELEQQITAYNLSRYGLGISFNGDILIRHMPEDRSLTYYRLPFPDAVRSVNFYYKRNRYMTRVVSEFLKLV